MRYPRYDVYNPRTFSESVVRGKRSAPAAAARRKSSAKRCWVGLGVCETV
ncbi:hypothetical protein HPTD01_1425 [Halomonas sp. TD01]|nr:hypothetical protein HPTD01_1425 [Halomonas sp. TD01]